MFDFDDKDEGGSVGPWISWKFKGTEDRNVDPRSFAIRGKDEHGNAFTAQFDGFKTGVALDLDSVKQGFIRDGSRGAPPERVWGTTKRPDESKKPSGAFAWSKAFSIRVATSKTETATWEDASWGGYEGFRRLATQIKAAGDQGNRSPVIVLTGVEEIDAKNGKAGVPIFEIKSWVNRPAAFATETMTGFDAAPETPLSQQAAPKAPAVAAEDAADFG